MEFAVSMKEDRHPLGGVVSRGVITAIDEVGVDEMQVRITVERVAMMNATENISWCSAPDDIPTEFFFLNLGEAVQLHDVGDDRLLLLYSGKRLSDASDTWYNFRLTLFPKGGSSLDWSNVSDDKYPVLADLDEPDLVL